MPNKDVTFRDNVIDNPIDNRSAWMHLPIAGPYSGLGREESNAAFPAIADDGLIVTGNVISNGGADVPLAIVELGMRYQMGNLSCNETQLMAENELNGR